MSGKIMQKLRTGSQSETPPPLPPNRPSTKGSGTPIQKVVKKCGCPVADCIHAYDQIRPTDSGLHAYETLGASEDIDLNTRIRKIEDNQVRLRLEFSQFCEDVRKELKMLHASVQEVKVAGSSLEGQLSDSTKLLKASVDKMHMQLLENSDHLGKQILDVRRDLAATGKTANKF